MDPISQTGDIFMPLFEIIRKQDKKGLDFLSRSSYNDPEEDFRLTSKRYTHHGSAWAHSGVVFCCAGLASFRAVFFATP